MLSVVFHYKLFVYWAKNGYKETPQHITEMFG